jgi:hypothetical protein
MHGREEYNDYHYNLVTLSLLPCSYQLFCHQCFCIINVDVNTVQKANLSILL